MACQAGAECPNTVVGLCAWLNGLPGGSWVSEYYGMRVCIAQWSEEEKPFQVHHGSRPCSNTTLATITGYKNHQNAHLKNAH